MSFDLSAYMNQAKQEMSNKNNGGEDYRKYPFKSIYIKPNATSTLVVRLLPNVASNLVSYQYWYHKSQNGYPIPCGYNYLGSNSCEVCNTVSEIKSVKGINVAEVAKPRSIVLAQYIASSGYESSEKYPLPKVGETVIIIGPAGLYNSVNKLLVDNSQAAGQILTAPQGVPVMITRDSNNRITVAPSLMQPIIVPGQETQELFDAYLATLPDIRTIPFEMPLSAEDTTKMREMSTNLRRTYLASPADQPRYTDAQSLNQMSQPVTQGVPVGVMPQQAIPQPQVVTAPVQPQPTVVQSQIPAPTQYVPQPQVSPAPVQVNPTPVPIPNAQVGQVATAPLPTATVDQATAVGVQQPTPIASVSNSFGTCPGKYDPTNNACLLCLDEPKCPYKN